ncbi:MAG: PqqD family protein [Bacteroides sp.]|nr:PqqD family protein [Bacteroides sp.]
MKIKKGFTLRKIMTQNVVLAEGSNADNYGKMITLNESAAMLWEALKDRSFEVEDAADLLVEKYAIDREQALADARYIINLMTEKSLLDL